MVNSLTQALFRSHVFGGSQSNAGTGQVNGLLRFEHLGNAEVGEHRFASLGHQDVSWFDVPMNYVMGMSMSQRLSNRDQ